MKSVIEVLELSSHFLSKYGIERSSRLAEELLASILSCQRIDLYLQHDRPLVEEELSLMREKMKRCIALEPLDYVLGRKDFFGCSIKMDKRALIPRQETEILVSLIAERVGALPKILWDICTGSGCIGVSLKKRCPSLSVVLSDLSKEALALARENAESNQVELECLEGDLLAPFKGRKADFIVCNPPYVSQEEYVALDPSVREFEPKMALVGGVLGVEFYQRLAQELPSFLNQGASLFFEIGSTQANRLKTIFSAPIWQESQVHKDWSGRDRFFFLKYNQLL